MTGDDNGIDHTYTYEIVCPHCGHEITDSWDICGDSMDDDIGILECGECERYFFAERIVTVQYSTRDLYPAERKRWEGKEPGGDK